MTSGSKTSKVAKIQNKYDYDKQPQTIEINGVLYKPTYGCGDKDRAHQDAAQRSGDTFVLKTNAYWVYTRDTSTMKELGYLEEEVKDSNPKRAAVAKNAISRIRKSVTKI